MRKLNKRSPLAQCLFHLALVSSFVILGAASSWAIVVTNTNNSGPGSLRQAILDARSDPAADVITFDPALFPATIDLLSLLPVLNSPGDTIDGAGNVTLNAVNLTATSDHGIRIFAGDITIRGLTIQNFGGDGIRVQPNPTLPGGQSGQVLTGIEISGNNITNNNQGIRVLGGDDTNEVELTITGNSVSNYSSGGIRVDGSNTVGTGGNNVIATISANVIRGAQPVNNPSNSLAGDGINVTGGLGTNTGDNVIQATISDNVIQNTFGEGLRVVGAGTGNSTSNNIIDVVITGNNIQGNGVGPTGGGNGVTITGGPTLGVPATTSGNIITFLVDGNSSNKNRDNGIGVQGSNGSNHEVSGTISNNNFNGNTDSGILLIARGSNNTLQDINIQNNNATNNGLGGLVLFGGDIIDTVNATISNILVDNNRFDSNTFDGILATRGTGPGNIVSFAGISNNSMNKNGRDGLFIPAGVNGSASPITGNRADRNSQDGIDIDSTGYVLSNNSASRNTVDGINAVGNVNGGGNTARNNASCNTPGCF